MAKYRLGVEKLGPRTCSPVCGSFLPVRLGTVWLRDQYELADHRASMHGGSVGKSMKAVSVWSLKRCTCPERLLISAEFQPGLEADWRSESRRPRVFGRERRSARGRRVSTSQALSHNNHDGTFTEVAQKAGVACEWKLYIFERPPFAFRPGECDGCRKAWRSTGHWAKGKRSSYLK